MIYTHNLSLRKLLDAYGVDMTIVKKISVKGDHVKVIQELS
jgi:hypothetical protein